MKKNIIFSNKITSILILVTGIFLGWLIFHPSGKSEEMHDHADEVAQNAIWTCSMHPQIRMDKSGDCPICGMDLIPLAQSGTAYSDKDAIHLSREAASLANVMTTVVSRQKPSKEIRLYGKVQSDERLLQNQVAHVPGRIEKLYVNFTGEFVTRGQVLAEIYSPELITAQQELLQTMETKNLQPELYEATLEKLRQWKLSDDQIKTIEKSGTLMNNFKVTSNTSGTVTSRGVNTGDYVSQGTVLFEIADLSKVWVLFDAYESDLQFLQKGKKVNFTFQALPGSDYSGIISFIDPVLDPVTRVARVRVEVENKSGKLKPEMFAAGIVTSELEQYGNGIVIPRSAVLWTGKRSIVYVKQPGDEYIFKLREIQLGPSLGESYVVTDGLSEGEEIVTSGTFSVDASAQLEGKPSMMNTSGGTTSAGHQHGEAKTPEINQDFQKQPVKKEFMQQLNKVFEQYTVLKNALVDSDAEKSKQASAGLGKTLSDVDMNLLTGDAHTKWMEIQSGLKKQLSAISAAATIDAQRTAFSELSDDLYKAIKIFGLNGKTVFYQFCPMAFNNKGAHWLSELQEIQNPYFGDEMLNCGETKETLKF